MTPILTMDKGGKYNYPRLAGQQTGSLRCPPGPSQKRDQHPLIRRDRLINQQSDCTVLADNRDHVAHSLVFVDNPVVVMHAHLFHHRIQIRVILAAGNHRHGAFEETAVGQGHQFPISAVSGQEDNPFPLRPGGNVILCTAHFDAVNQCISLAVVQATGFHQRRPKIFECFQSNRFRCFQGATPLRLRPHVGQRLSNVVDGHLAAYRQQAVHDSPDQPPRRADKGLGYTRNQQCKEIEDGRLNGPENPFHACSIIVTINRATFCAAPPPPRSERTPANLFLISSS